MLEIFVDADACPVKDEVYDVASRHGIYVFIVANSRMRVPEGAGVEMVLVEDGPDAADDWIAEHIRPADVAVTADIPLAARCLEAGARVLGTHGQPFTEDSIGAALATRDLKADLRESGLIGGGPPPLSQRDRSRFATSLDRLVQQGMSELR
ncbi:MAG: YaiI/YqxD family protein [Myxococcota bacterium]